MSSASLTGESSSTAGPSQSHEADNTQKKKRVRTSRPKVKTGCNNCKQRRIKCDEKRPACTQCTRSRKTCTGYPPPPRSARSHEVLAIAPKPFAAIPSSAPHNLPLVRLSRRSSERQHTTTPQAPATLLYRPSTTLRLLPLEGLYFQLFRTHTACELSGYFDSVFWTRTVLQECHTEDAIRHAVIALGALYKTLEQSSESPPGSPTNHDAMGNALTHREVAVRQYSKAINALVRLNSQEQRSHRVLLMASVLLGCFDSFIGDHRQGIRQIQNGLGLLEKLRAEQRKSDLSGPEEPVEQELITMFTRLAIQAKSYDMAFHFPQPYVIRLTPSTAKPGLSPEAAGGSPPSTASNPLISRFSFPSRFSSLMEARHAWDNLLEAMMRFTETMFNYAHASGSNNPMGILPKELQQYGLSFRGHLDAWCEAFEPILQSRWGPGITDQEKTGIAVLKMFQIMSQILYLMTFSASESQFDVFQPQFETIVGLAVEVVGDEERRAAAKRCPDTSRCPHPGPHDKVSDGFGQRHEPAVATRHIKPSFSADLGIVPPLFVVATKCRHPVTRRQAIRLLRSSARREAMWDSELTARIGDWIATIEEEGVVGVPADAVNYRGAAPVPEERRVMVRAVDFDLRARSATLQVGTRGITPGSPDLRSRVTQIRW